MKHVKDLILRITLKEILYFVATFAVILVGAKLGQYIYFNWQTSPAVLWPPTGIALAILYIGGYRYAIPIFLGLLTASLTGPIHLIPAVFTTPLGQVLGLIAGVYLLRRYNFDGVFATVRNVLVFLFVIVIASMIAPSITTLISIATDNLTAAAYISWSRTWAGYIFSCLILTPLILSWIKPDYRIIIRSPIESAIAGLLILVSVYLLFWTRVASEFSFLAFALFFFAHFSVSYRFSTKVVTLSIFVTTFVGILGLFLSPNPERALNSQLFATELFLFLVVPIFYIFTALVKERTNTIEELKEAVNKIEMESVVKSNFISVLAHELRNPLAPVKTTLELLAEQKLEPKIQELIKSARYQVHAMRRMLDDLLDITRVTQGKFQLQVEQSHFCTMIDRSVSLTKSLFADRVREFVVEPVCDDSIWVNVDPVRFEQAVVNILNNAVKYTQEGGRITIVPRVKANLLELQIKDNGVGIAKENLTNIFEAFWQEKNSPKSASGGVGVGLPLTEHIIKLHGGSVKAESAGKGQGSTFTISMPFSRKEISFKEKGDTKLVEKSVPLCKILVVDDNHAAADSLMKLLNLKGHEAQTAYSGLDALRVAKDSKLDVILLDIGLPDIGGYEVAKRLRANGFKNKIVALSGYGQKEDKEAAVKAGCDEHITKPMGIARFEEYLISMRS